MKVTFTQILFFVCMGLLVYQSASTQIPSDKRKIQYHHPTVLHLDKPFYVTGEYIWFKAYLPIEYTGQNIALRASLYNSDLQVHEQFFVPTNGQASVFGHFKIPFDWQTGAYQLAISGLNTVSQKNVQLIVQTNLLIFNDLEETDMQTKDSVLSPITNYRSSLQSDLLPTQKESFSKSRLQIRLSADTIQTLEQVSTTIEVKDSHGKPVAATSLSVTVRDWDLTTDSTQVPSILFWEKSADALPLPLSKNIHLMYCFL